MDMQKQWPYKAPQLAQRATHRVNHEGSFVQAFISPERRSRYLQLLTDPKRRQKILDRLNYNLDYIPSLVHELSQSQDRPEVIEQLLRSKGAGPTCHIMSDGLATDGQEAPLLTALKQIWGHSFGSIASCIPGRLAYYKPQAPSRGLILEWNP